MPTEKMLQVLLIIGERNRKNAESIVQDAKKNLSIALATEIHYVSQDDCDCAYCDAFRREGVRHGFVCMCFECRDESLVRMRTYCDLINTFASA